MPPFNERQLQQQLRAFLVFIQLHIMMYLLFLRRPQQPPQAAPPPPARQRPRRRHNMWVRPWLLQRQERGPTTTLCLNSMPQTFQDSPTTDQTGTMSSQAGHQLQSSYQCWGEVSPHHQISGHWRVIHIIILSVQGWQIHHFQVSTRSLQGHPG